MCGLDALHSANMNMILDRDWQRIMSALPLTKPPVLCRRQRIPSWSLGPGFDASPADTVIEMALGAMRPSDHIGAALTSWARRIRGAFPELSEEISARLSETPDKSLRQQCEALAVAPRSPVTRAFVSSSTP